MKRRHHDALRRLVDAHFAGTSSPSAERELRAHLPVCVECRRYYERHLLLEELDPRGLGPEDRIGLALGIRRRERPSSGWAFAALGAIAAVAGVSMFLRTGVVGSPRPEFAARGAERSIAAPDLVIYRLRPNERAEVVGDSIGSNDELAFAYANPGAFEHLLVFGVDEHRHIYWYYPAWSSETEDPVGIPLSAGPEVRELPEAISQPLDGKSLRIVGLFTHDSVSVKDVERMLRDDPSGSIEVARRIPGAVQTEIPLRIERP